MVAVLNTEACHVRNFRAFADPDPTPDAQVSADLSKPRPYNPKP
jgi:hypothetical protein